MTKTKAGDRDAANDEQLIGTVLNERYRLDDVVARGGMGTIFVGTQLGLERRIAVKMVHAHLVADSDTRKRFEREAAAMTRFNHPDCVMIFDYGTHGARPFIVMEWVAGRPLSEILSTSHPFPCIASPASSAASATCSRRPTRRGSSIATSSSRTSS